MQEQLKVALIQADLVWENPKSNRENFTHKIKGINTDVDLVILPEMFSSGFTMNAPKVSESMTGETVMWMKQMAAYKNVAIVGSLVIAEENKFYNRLLFVEPSGQVTHYNKRHTFTLVGEQKVYTAGTNKIVVNFKGWKICPLICYDLRFPVWSRNTEDYDVLIYVANWPKPRVAAWNALLKARAIENMAYCIGVNRVGVDGVNSLYTGHSSVYDVLGEEISNIKPNTEQIEIVTLEKRHISAYRNKFKFLNDRDSFTF
ncbi:nitrilase family protein [Postechiella marina]|uniref:Nitrilase family protein n=1 Tax=Postechiella marina TaxID=943941 RepID=A0ABP8C4B2_9FLAO